MTALPHVPQVLSAALTWTVDGDAHALTRHFIKYSGGPPSSTDCATMGGQIVASAELAFQSLVSAHGGAASCEVTDLTSSTSGQGSGGTPWSGTASGGLLAPGTAVVVSHSIPRRYRGGKPRTYLPIGVTTDVETTGLWKSASVTAFEAAWTSFVSNVLGVGSGCTLTNFVNVSYYDGSTVVISPTTGRARNVPTLRATPLVDNFSASTTRSNIGSQRRRNRNA